MTDTSDKAALAGKCLNCDAEVELSNAACMDLVQKAKEESAAEVRELRGGTRLVRTNANRTRRDEFKSALCAGEA